jgi:Zn-finger protein
MMVPKPERKRRKAEPVKKVLLQTEKECIFCGTTQHLERHHCIHGTGNRQKAGKYGLTVWLCSDCHRGPGGVHDNATTDLLLECYAQQQFEKLYSREKWMEVFGKSYL